MQTEHSIVNVKPETSVGASTVVAVNNLTKKFNSPMDGKEFVVLDSISLHVDEGEFAAIVGPSGCGKSTLLNIIAGIETHDPDEGGSVEVRGSRSPVLGDDGGHILHSLPVSRQDVLKQRLGRRKQCLEMRNAFEAAGQLFVHPFRCLH